MANKGVKAGYWFNDSDLSACDIYANPFTHLFCGYAGINLETFEVTISRSCETFSLIVKECSSSDVKTLLSIGGADVDAKAVSFAAMAFMPEYRKSFIRSSVDLARKWKFDGLDLQWLYPSSESDMDNLAALLHEWQSEIVQEAETYHQPQLLLVATVFYFPYSQFFRYPIETIRTTLDWVNVITYDFLTPTSASKFTAPPSAFHNPNINTYSGYEGIKAWINEGLPAEMIVFGIPFHGWAWKLESSNLHDLFSPACGPAEGLDDISSDGLIEYSNIKKFILLNDACTSIKELYPLAYTYSGTTWIAYEDEQTIKIKIGEARDKLKLLGYFAWNIANDDDDSTLTTAASKEWGGDFCNFLSQ